MQNYPIVYLILKRMRAPLILLILSYTIAVAGMAIIPGIDDDGNPVHLTIFQSFYFISYVATTIGFGEIPYQFTDMQRLWVIFCIYLTVIAWLVAIGKIIALLQDPALQTAWIRQKFNRQVKAISDHFFIICGYGETGEMLLHRLIDRGFDCVVVDNDPERVNLLDLDSSIYRVPFLRGDASNVEILKMAGLESGRCRAVLAVTRNDRINVKIAVAAKLLCPGVEVVCRVHSKEAMANAKSFDTDYVVNPDRLYAEKIALAFRKPNVQQLTSSLLRRSGSDYIKKSNLPRGHWIVCGDSQLAEEVVRFLDYEGLDYTVVSDTASDDDYHVKGRGTEAVTLRAAGIDKSVGIIAATDDDTDNFSIIVTARNLKHNLYLVAKQNLESNHHIFKHAAIDAVLESSRQLVWQIMPLITHSYLIDFLRLARHQSDEWGSEIMNKLLELSDKVPSVYELAIDSENAPAICQYLKLGNILRLQELYSDQLAETGKMTALPLMLARDGNHELLPNLSTALKYGDVFLVASSEEAKADVLYTMGHEQDFYYLIHGKEKPASIVIHLIRERIKEFKLYRRQKKKGKPLNHRDGS
ncbi:MAG: potassium transporter TrkA [Gammaproteobacteria bacterium]|nr:MAG: potassium transporter TrkA [Gammaproteobacteria bacterium]